MKLANQRNTQSDETSESKCACFSREMISLVSGEYAFAQIWATKLSFRLDYLYCWELFFIFSEEVAQFTNFIFIQEIGDKGSTHRYGYTMPSSCLWWFSISIDSTKSYSEKQYALIGTNYLRDYDCPFQRSYKFLKISMSSRKISVVIHVLAGCYIYFRRTCWKEFSRHLSFISYKIF